MSPSSQLTFNLPDVAPLAVSMADFVVLRIAALPFTAIEALRMPRCEALVRDILDAERAMEAERPLVEDALHALVPQLDLAETELRRRIVNLRRDVHNARPAKTNTLKQDQISQLLRGEGCAAFNRWTTAQAALAISTRRLAEELPQEMRTSLRPAVRRPLQVPNFRRALQFGNPSMERIAAREKKLPHTPWPESLERALLGYLARAAAKTSPFSSFMSLAVVGADPEADTPWPAVAQAGYAHSVSLNRGVVARLDRASRIFAARAGDISLTVNSTLRRKLNGRLVALCNREIVLIGRPWYEQRFAQFKLQPRLAELLEPGLSDSWGNWHARMVQAGLPADGLDAALGKLVERGILVADALTDSFDSAPLDRLADRWRDSASPRLSQLAPKLTAVNRLVRTVAAAPGPERIAAIEAVHTAEDCLLDRLGVPVRPADEMFQNHVLEDCWLSGISGQLGRNLLAPLADLDEFLGGQVIVSPFYSRLRAAFVQRFGVGGSCDDALDFLLRAAERLIDIPEFGAWMVKDEIVAAPPGVELPVTAHVQIAAGPHRPAALLVVNRVFDGAGWLAARFTAGEEPGQRLLTQRLTGWLKRLGGGREPVDVVLGGHCNDLQAHAPITRRVLRWPGEHLTVDPARIIEAADLRLTHDPATDLITVADRQGVLLSLHYLGTTFPSPIWGVRYALTVLTQPYLVARPDVAPPAARDFNSITFEPAVVHGNVVLRRPTWWVSTDYLRREWLAGSEAERLVKALRDCERYGVPPCLFAQRYIAPDRSSLLPTDVLNANRKPIWIDVRNPFWLATLERLAKDGDWVSLAEALPGPDDLWLRIDGHPHVSELHIEMVVRSRRKLSDQPPVRHS